MGRSAADSDGEIGSINLLFRAHRYVVRYTTRFITEMFHQLIEELKEKLPDLGVKTAADSKARHTTDVLRWSALTAASTKYSVSSITRFAVKQKWRCASPSRWW